MPSIFSLNKNTISLLLLNIGLLLTSLPLILSKPTTNLRSTSTLGDNNTSTPDGCWIQSYGRGVGKPITTCPNGLENDASLCYTPCKSGFSGAGPVCWQSCPAGYKDTGADCLKPSSYGRGGGYTSESKCSKANSQGCEKYLALWYPKCANGFRAFGCCTCTPNCPSGMLDIGVSCQKQSYGRGVGKPLVCTSSQDENAGLCYTKCKAGWNGNGPVCWGTCPAGMYKCGALCVESGMTCTTDMLEIANKVLEAINKEGDEDEDEEQIDIGDTGVDVGDQLAQYGMCKNM